MCLLALAWKMHPQWPLWVAANRDELHLRQTAPLHEWVDGTIGGRDLEAGGAWMGARRNGRFAAVTNFRDPLDVGAGLRSRGALVAQFLASELSPQQYAEEISARTAEFRGFNLLVGDAGQLWYVGSRAAAPHALGRGIHTLSNHVLNTPWPKTERLRSRLEHALTQLDPEPALFSALADRSHARDSELPDTGVSQATERLLSAALIISPGYGTRSSTVLALAAGRGQIVERSWTPDGSPAGTARVQW